jgi:hypothetical protein
VNASAAVERRLGLAERAAAAYVANPQVAAVLVATSGSAYGIFVSETPHKQWLVAELGGCC